MIFILPFCTKMLPGIPLKKTVPLKIWTQFLGLALLFQMSLKTVLHEFAKTPLEKPVIKSCGLFTFG